MNEHKSAAMWKLYAKTNEAVCIQSTFRRLREALGDAARVGVVRYVDYETEWIPESNLMAPFLYKRKSFEHEHEVRAIVPLGELRKLKQKADVGLPDEKGRWVSANLLDIMQRIYVAPDSPDWFHQLVKNVTAHYQHDGVEVIRSTLAQSPFY